MKNNSSKRSREAIKFNKSLRIPAKWTVDIEICDDEPIENPTYHVFIHTKLKMQEFEREHNRFLCSTDKIEYGDCRETYLGDGSRYDTKVSCKSCLKIAERFKDIESENKVKLSLRNFEDNQIEIWTTLDGIMNKTVEDWENSCINCSCNNECICGGRFKVYFLKEIEII